jgi:Domain of unknown function (DUF6531)
VTDSTGQIQYCTQPIANCADCEAGNPTQPGLGTKIERSTDYAGAGAHPLLFERIYRSTWLPQIPQSRVGGFWAHNYSASARILEGSNAGARYAFVTRADGQHHVFTNTNGTWLAATRTRDVLSEVRDTAGALTGLQVQVWQDNSTETYDLSGRLQKIVARNGWTTTLAYSDATTPVAIAPRAGLLISVKNQFARELRFTYDAQGRMVELLPPGAVAGSGAGSATSPIRYAYDEAASLGAGVPAQGQLSSVTWQDGSVRRYHHERSDVWYIANGPQLLTGITDEAGVRYATWVYDGIAPYGSNLPGARVVSSEHAGGADRLEFSYYTNATGQAVTSITDYSSGSAQQSVHTYSNIGNTRVPVLVSAPCPQCGNTQQASTYNTASDATRQIAHDGSVTFLAYDSKGRETERASFPSSYQAATTRPALNNATRVVSTKWHATWNLPTQLAEPGKVTAYMYSSKGNLTAESWTATTDATGAAKFTAVKTGSTFATGWSFSASNLATTVITKETPAGATVAVETGRWTYTHDASGSRITETDKVTNKTSKTLALSPSGHVLEGIDADNIRFRFVRDPRGQAIEHHFGIPTAKLVSTTGGITNAANGFLARYSYDGSGRLTTTQRSNAATLTFSYSVAGVVTAVTESPSASASVSARAALAALTATAAVTPIPIGGSGTFICSRGTTILPLEVGNHAYLWDATSRRCCGRDQNRDPLLNCNEPGPPTHACTFVEGSVGKERDIFTCCQRTANNGRWVPYKNDCHDSAERCVVASGLKYPGAPGGRSGSCSSCWRRSPPGDLPTPPVPTTP